MDFVFLFSPASHFPSRTLQSLHYNYPYYLLVFSEKREAQNPQRRLTGKGAYDGTPWVFVFVLKDSTFSRKPSDKPSDKLYKMRYIL